MDAARQVVRWSIPGWVLLLMLVVMQILTRLSQGRSWDDIIHSPLISGLSPAAVALIVTAGIPLGFIIYQIYYSWYGRVLVFHLVNRDRGAEILLSLPKQTRNNLLAVDDYHADLEEMSIKVKSFVLPYPLRRLKPEFRNRAGRRRFEAKAQTNWDIVRFWLNYICIRHKTDHIKAEVTTLADIYHGIGATRTALFCACVLHFLYNVFLTTYGWSESGRVILALLLPYLVALWLFRAFERTRTAALNSLMSMLKHALACFSLEQEPPPSLAILKDQVAGVS